MEALYKYRPARPGNADPRSRQPRLARALAYSSAGERKRRLRFRFLCSFGGQLSSYPVERLGAVRQSNIDAVADLVSRTDIEPNFLDVLNMVAASRVARRNLAANSNSKHETLKNC